MIVAIRARGRTLGALTFATAESGRRYGPDDLALAEDLAHRAALAVDNARLYAEAQEANRVKDEFLATVSHELRTPLSSMMNWVALLRQGKIGPEQVTRGLDVLQRSGEAQARLIDDILDVSRIVSGRLRLQPQPVELADVVRDAIETVRPAADAKRVRARGPRRADRRARRRAIRRACSRSCGISWRTASSSRPRADASPCASSGRREDAQHHRHRLRRGHRAGVPAVRVRPLPPGGARREPAPRGPRPRARHREAPGRGARRAGGGTERGPGHGATFVVRLPPRPLRLSRAPPSSRMRAWGEAVRKPVLIVEDDESAREALAAFLAAEGYPVLEAANGREALDRLQQDAVGPSCSTS